MGEIIWGLSLLKDTGAALKWRSFRQIGWKKHCWENGENTPIFESGMGPQVAPWYFTVDVSHPKLSNLPFLHEIMEFSLEKTSKIFLGP